ncbi:MAG: LysR family transcriptional regulator, partial [Oscillospiraceae bacterium]
VIMMRCTMELKQLNYFVAIAQNGSINKAAQSLFISQPYLSHVVKDLEDELGIRLLIRNKNGVSLTAEGERFFNYAVRIIKLKDNFAQKKLSREGLNVSMTKFSHVMEAFIDVCRKTEESTNFIYRLNEGSPLEVINDLKNHISQVGVIHYDEGAEKEYQKLIDDNDLKYFPLTILNPCVVLSSTHPVYLKNPKEIDIEDLADYGFVRYIGQFEDFIYNLIIDGKLKDLDSSPKIVYIYGRATLLHLIAATNFYTVGIKDFDIQRQVYNIVSVPIKGCKNRLKFGYIIPRDVELTDTALLFLENLKQAFKEEEVF